MRSTFKVLFYLKKNAPKKNGSVPVMCRITIDGTIAQFSCKCDIHPDLWDIKSNRASGKSTVALETNRFLDKIQGDSRKGQLCHSGESKERLLGFGNATRNLAESLRPAQ